MWRDDILNRGTFLNSAILENAIEFKQLKVNVENNDIEHTANYYSYHFPHWMLESLDDGMVKLVHPYIPNFYIDPWLIDTLRPEDLSKICGNVIKESQYTVSFEDSYFLDCFFQHCHLEETLLIIHIDNHSDRGWFFGSNTDNYSTISIGSTGEIFPLDLSENCVKLLRGEGIIHQGNFLSLFSYSPSRVHVVFATDELNDSTPIFGVNPRILPDSEENLITIFELNDDTKNSNFTWQEGPRKSLDSMIRVAIESLSDPQIMVHIDLDEYDNPWDGNSVNESNLAGETSNVIEMFRRDIEIIHQFNPIHWHYCMPAGFFPAKHWLSVLNFLEEFHD